MAEEADDHLGVAFEATRLATGEAMQVVDRARQSVRHRALDEGAEALIATG